MQENDVALSWLSFEGVQIQAFPRERFSRLILYLLHPKLLPRVLHKLQISSSPLLEAEVDDSFFAQIKELFKRSEKQGESRLKVDTVGRQNHIRLLFDNGFW